MNWRAFLASPPLQELELTEHAAPNVRSGVERTHRQFKYSRSVISGLYEVSYRDFISPRLQVSGATFKWTRQARASCCGSGRVLNPTTRISKPMRRGGKADDRPFDQKTTAI
jgi:hypothetical protein